MSSSGTLSVRAFGWVMLTLMGVFLTNNILTFVFGLPGEGSALAGSGGALGWAQFLFYPAAGIAVLFAVLGSKDRTLRQDAARISKMNETFIRCAFWVVLLVGLGDMILSFLRVEGFLPALVGEELTRELGKSQFRGFYFHLPLLAIGIGIGLITHSLGFIWLALLIVAAELLIVITRFIFSYEQAFMADLVRFWYGALFLFASAYTLLEEGHVRVDVFYAGFKDRTKGAINAVGSVFLGIVLCWTILVVGMGSKSAVINSPVLRFEVTQSGFGMYVKYMMAGFLGVFAISMMIQFVSYLMESWADWRGEEGKRKVSAPGAH